MVQGEVEKKPPKPVRKLSLSPIRSDLSQRTRADAGNKTTPVEMKHARQRRRMDLRRKLGATWMRAALLAIVVAGGVYLGGKGLRLWAVVVWGVGVGWGTAAWGAVVGWVKGLGKYGWLVPAGAPVLAVFVVWWLTERRKRVRERRQWMEPMYRALIKHLEHMQTCGSMWGPLWTELKEEVERAGHFCNKREWRYLEEVLEGSRNYQGGQDNAREGKEWAKEQKKRARSVFGWLVRV